MFLGGGLRGERVADVCWVSVENRPDTSQLQKAINSGRGLP